MRNASLSRERFYKAACGIQVKVIISQGTIGTQSVE